MLLKQLAKMRLTFSQRTDNFLVFQQHCFYLIERLSHSVFKCIRCLRQDKFRTLGTRDKFNAILACQASWLCSCQSGIVASVQTARF